MALAHFHVGIAGTLTAQQKQNAANLAVQQLPHRPLPRTAGWGAAGGRQRRGRRLPRPLVLAESGPPHMIPDLSLPKFMPFTPQNALQQAMLNYRFQREVGPEGQMLLVTALTPEWVPAAADLLTESFASALGAAPYTNFLRRQVKAYLEQHRRLPPKAVVLVALLLPAELATAAVEAAEAGAAALPSSSDSSSNGGSTSEVASSSSSSNSSGSSSLGGAWQQQQQEPEQQQQLEAAEEGDGMAMHPLLSTLASESSSGSSSEEEGEQQQQQYAPDSGAVLAGVVELSFSASTRSQYLTLNPPEDRPYLCNMAVAKDLRGRGYGLALLQAAEALVAQLGENEVYLHLRVQDDAAAALYKKDGFGEVAADSFVVRLIGMDQRRLMVKRLPRAQPVAAATTAAAAAGQQGQQPSGTAAAPVKQKLRMDL